MKRVSKVDYLSEIDENFEMKLFSGVKNKNCKHVDFFFQYIFILYINEPNSPDPEAGILRSTSHECRAGCTIMPPDVLLCVGYNTPNIAIGKSTLRSRKRNS